MGEEGRGEHDWFEFRQLDMLRIVHTVLTDPWKPRIGFYGAGIDTNDLIGKGHLLCMFPKADRRTLKAFDQSWSRFSLMWDVFHPLGFMSQPLDDITAYYGEKIGMYFAFLGFYTKLLVVPAATGAISLTYCVIQAYACMYIPTI